MRAKRCECMVESPGCPLARGALNGPTSPMDIRHAIQRFVRKMDQPSESHRACPSLSELQTFARRPINLQTRCAACLPSGPPCPADWLFWPVFAHGGWVAKGDQQHAMTVFLTDGLLGFSICWVIAVDLRWPDDAWVGQQVFIKGDGQAEAGQQDVRLGTRWPMPATVTKVDGDWLWVGKAWVRAARSSNATTAQLLCHVPARRSRTPPTRTCSGGAWRLKARLRQCPAGFHRSHSLAT